MNTTQNVPKRPKINCHKYDNKYDKKSNIYCRTYDIKCDTKLNKLP